MNIWKTTYTWSDDNTKCTANAVGKPIPDIPSGDYYSTQQGKHKLIKLIGFGGQDNKNTKTYKDDSNKFKTNSQSSIMGNSNLKPYVKMFIGNDAETTPPTETEQSTVVKTTIQSASCTDDGSALCTANFTNPIFVTQEKDVVIPKFGHIVGYTKIEVVVASTCTAEGISDVITYCRICGEEISRYQTPSEKKAHKAGKQIKENIVSGTCVTDGTYDVVVYCRNCGTELSRRTVSTGLDNTVHVHIQTVEENRIEPTADTDGSYDEVVYCDDCGNELSRTTHTIPHS